MKHKGWLWRASCGLCWYKSRFYKSRQIARLLALLHVWTNHPYDHMTISAVDTDTYQRNREEAEGTDDGCRSVLLGIAVIGALLGLMLCAYWIGSLADGWM